MFYNFWKRTGKLYRKGKSFILYQLKGRTHEYEKYHGWEIFLKYIFLVL